MNEGIQPVTVLTLLQITFSWDISCPKHGTFLHSPHSDIIQVSTSSLLVFIANWVNKILLQGPWICASSCWTQQRKLQREKWLGSVPTAQISQRQGQMATKKETLCLLSWKLIISTAVMLLANVSFHNSIFKNITLEVINCQLLFDYLSLELAT